MKTTNTLRILSLIGFLLLFAPFYDSCDGKYVLQRIPENNVVVQKSLKEKINDFIFDENAFSAVDISIPMFANSFKETKEELIETFKKKDWYSNLVIPISLLFNLIILFSFLILVLSLFKRNKILNKLALINSILIIISFLYVVFLESSFNHFRQIKYGYYAFIIVTILIYFYSKKAIESNTKV